MLKISQKEVSKFWSKVDKNQIGQGCWIWIGHITNYGYGTIWAGRKMLKSHRLSWIVSKGQIPKSKCVLHRCDNRRCVNPNHLFLGTYLDNNSDRANKGRSSRGEIHPKAKLNPKKVLKIRELRKVDGFTYIKLAEMFGICSASVRSIIGKKNWKHI